MTTQAVIQDATVVRRATGLAVAARVPRLADLLSVPGILQLSLANALSQSFAMRMQGIVVAWLVLDMTGSRLWLGIVNGFPGVSIVVFSLLGGVLADSRDARRVLVAVRSMLATAAFLALILAMTGQIRIEYLIVYVLLAVGLSAVDMPVSRTLTMQVVGPARLMSANALQTLGTNLANIVTPISIAVLIGEAGAGAAFGVLGVGYVLGAALLAKSRVSVGVSAERRRSHPVADLVSGLAYVRSTPTVAALVALGFLMPFAGTYFAMVPVFARDVLSAGAGGLGLLVGAFSAGSLAGSTVLVTHGEIGGRGRKVAVLSVLFGIGMVAFGLSQSLLLSSAISLSMGFVAAFWQNMLTTMVQTVAAPEMKGRALSVFTMGFQLASLGWLLGGLSASVLGPEWTVVIAGVCFAGFSTLIFTFSKAVRAVN